MLYLRMLARRRDQSEIGDLPCIAQLLVHRCQALGLTQAQVAEQLETASVSTVSRFLRGQSRPSVEELKALASVIKTPLETLWAMQLLDSDPGCTGFVVLAQQLLMRGSSRLLLVGDITFDDGLLGAENAVVDMILPVSVVREVDHQVALATTARQVASLAAVTSGQIGARDLRIWSADIFEAPVHNLVANDYVAITRQPRISVSFSPSEGWEELAARPRVRLDRLVEEDSDAILWRRGWGDANPQLRWGRSVILPLLDVLRRQEFFPERSPSAPPGSHKASAPWNTREGGVKHAAASATSVWNLDVPVAEDCHGHMTVELRARDGGAGAGYLLIDFTEELVGWNLTLSARDGRKWKGMLGETMTEQLLAPKLGYDPWQHATFLTLAPTL